MPSVSELEAMLEEAKKSVPVPVIGKDCTGSDVAVGDTVTLTCKVTGVHNGTRTVNGKEEACNLLNLAIAGEHAFTLHSDKVEKALGE